MQPAVAHEQLTIARPARPVALARLRTLARRKPVGALAVMFVLLMVVAALLADVLAVHTPVSIDPRMRLIGPGAIARDGGIYLLGGDELGRDLFARVLHGARVSLAVGIVAVGIGTVTGAILGLISGYFMGKVDLIIQRIEDAQQAIPSLLLAMLLVSVLPPSLWVVTAAVGITQVPRVNRVVRGAVLSIKQNAYMDAARAIGCRTPNILLSYLLPNVLPNIIIIATTSLGGAIITEASLSFLGFGVPPPTPSWGGMISAGGREYMFDNPMLLFVPAVALSITVLSFNLAGDALRDILDPKLRGR
mgnify:CR=1 FL=1